MRSVGRAPGRASGGARPGRRSALRPAPVRPASLVRPLRLPHRRVRPTQRGRLGPTGAPLRRTRACSPLSARPQVRNSSDPTGPGDCYETDVGGLREHERRSLGAGSGERCGVAPPEDRESSTRCRQSLEEAQAAMLSSGSLHFGGPRVRPGFPVRPTARSSEVLPSLPAPTVVVPPRTQRGLVLHTCG